MADIQGIPGKYQWAEIRTSAIVSTSWEEYIIAKDARPDRWDGVEDANLFILDIFFTIGSLTNVILEIYTSNDGVIYTPVTVSDLATSIGDAGLAKLTATLTASADVQWTIRDLMANFIKIRWKGTGTVTSSLLALQARLGRRPITD
jgi:hypothetical protein